MRKYRKTVALIAIFSILVLVFVILEVMNLTDNRFVDDHTLPIETVPAITQSTESPVSESTLAPTPPLSPTATPEPSSFPLAGITLGAGDKWAAYAVDVLSDKYAEFYSADAEEQMIAASIIKIFIAGAVYSEAVENAAFTIDSAKLKNLENMLRDSDNNAANALVSDLGGGDFQCGASLVNAFAADIGCLDTELNRKFVTGSGEPMIGENYTSVSDCAKALTLIARGEFVSKDASEMIYSFLKADASWNANKDTKIRAGVWAVDPEAVIANKTGENAPPTAPRIVENDIAIVESGGVRYVICVMSNSNNSAEAKRIIKDIAGNVHRFFTERP
jgi:beta-lactamase class A